MCSLVSADGIYFALDLYHKKTPLCWQVDGSDLLDNLYAYANSALIHGRTDEAFLTWIGSFFLYTQNVYWDNVGVLKQARRHAEHIHIWSLLDRQSLSPRVRTGKWMTLSISIVGFPFFASIIKGSGDRWLLATITVEGMRSLADELCSLLD